MIELYSGTPGSGKSLHTAKEIRSRLKMFKRFIIGNFRVDTKIIEHCKGSYIYVANDRLEPDRLLHFSRHLSMHLGRRLKEGEILLIIDEAQLLFNSREWQHIGRNGWLSFFSQHRHYGYDIILAAQFDRMLDRQIRSLIEYEHIHRKVSRFGYAGFFIGLLTGDNLYAAIKFWYPVKERVESNFFFGSRRLFAMYDSYGHFDAPEHSGKKQRMSGDKRGPTITLSFAGNLPAASQNLEDIPEEPSEKQEEAAENTAG